MSSGYPLVKIVEGVLETLHERSDICVGADTCEARGAIDPLVKECERLAGLYEAQTENYRDENEIRAIAEAKIADALLLAEKWVRSSDVRERWCGNDLKQVLGG